MKKTIFVVALSIAGFIAVWRFEPGPVHNTAAVAQAPPSAGATATPAAPSTAPSTSDSPDATVTTQGSAESSKYGVVQVQVTFTGSRLTAITLLQAPNEGRALTALPRLQEEAMQAQSADIDTITGATETSESYKTSLQAAIDARGNR
ncbi:FMN-binding protein [Amycolatopsis solani]|uniref:FMN-binding protein n=1 Tax=Amycolatopsis solani TaxID=3028615 RepID=UPI0025B22647|nr:FMN-binding protein [Amycolatopsis sp. MEP2-6]